jgi:hypothetical protein
MVEEKLKLEKKTKLEKLFRTSLELYYHPSGFQRAAEKTNKYFNFSPIVSELTINLAGCIDIAKYSTYVALLTYDHQIK